MATPWRPPAATPPRPRRPSSKPRSTAPRRCEAIRAGRYEEALRLFDRSGGVYARLIARRPSDPDLYAEDCERREQEIQAAMPLADVPETRVQDGPRRLRPGVAGRSRADRARWSGRPASSGAWGSRSSSAAPIRRRTSRPASAWRRGPSRSIPRDVQGYDHLAVAHRLLAQWKMGQRQRRARRHRAGDRGRPPRRRHPARDALRPRQPGHRLHRARPGPAAPGRRPARSAVDQAVASYQQAGALNPQSLPAFIGLGNAWKVMSEVEIAQGLGPQRLGRAGRWRRWSGRRRSTRARRRSTTTSATPT